MRTDNIHPIHPFPARMAPAIIWEKLPNSGKKLRILDPMAGSGTTLVTARQRGHEIIGCDTDPLAILISKAWCSDIDTKNLLSLGKKIVRDASTYTAKIDVDRAYPTNVDSETREFIDFWFDGGNRIELTALANCISRISDPEERNLLWCAFSRLIITKSSGVSLAMDVSHSRPHRVYKKAPIRPIERFLYSLEYIAKRAPFTQQDSTLSNATVVSADARNLPLVDNCIDFVITSPPYLNAIDYLRGHKLSLVWMGFSISQLRSIRSGNIGTEVSTHDLESDVCISAIQEAVNVSLLETRTRGMLFRYFNDMKCVMEELKRVLRRQGYLILVVGDSLLRGVIIKNSEGLKSIGRNLGFQFISEEVRLIPNNRRYLPPPDLVVNGSQLEKRIKNEVILTFRSEDL